MLYSRGHGQPAYYSAPISKNMKRTFRYYNKSLPMQTHDASTAQLLSNLGAAMTDATNFGEPVNAGLAPVFTYIGQFLDHDLSAGTDFDPVADVRMENMRQSNTGVDLTPVSRDDAEESIVNDNTARLDLDSLYGDELLMSDFDHAMAKAMRSHRPGKMRIAFPEFVVGSDNNERIVDKPKDRAGDLLRLREVMGGAITEEMLNGLDPKLKKIFFNGDGTPNMHRAIIGDMRNDENLFVAQFHLSLLRLHNRVVDACRDSTVINAGSDALYNWAKTQVRYLYQWLIVNVFLKGVCDSSVLEKVLSDEAAVYTRFLEDTGGPADGGRLPLPMEFSVAAYRFGHSMAREAYDWNEFFPNGAASLRLLFGFTGGMNMLGGVTDSRLPSDWVADWPRLATFDPSNDFQSTRGIDTQLSKGLDTLDNDPKRNLAILNLQKGHILNLPPAQSLIDHLDPNGNYGITALTAVEIASGGTEDAVKGTRLETETPLWFYCLKEAELKGSSRHLGPLGSLIVASTILGLLIHDQGSYWHASGSDNGRWHPNDMVHPSGVTVTDIETLMQAALLI